MTYLFSNTSSIFQSNGSAITTVNPLPVTLGSANINIIGNITVPTVVNVASSPENPVHTHITEVGTSGNLLANNISYMPIGGNVIAFQGTSPWVTTATVSGGNVNVSNLPDVSVTAFEEPLAVGITPLLQGDAVYGLDPDFWSNTSLRGGNVISTTQNLFQVNSGTSAGGYARLATSRYVNYQPGQGLMFRWTAAFTNGVDANINTKNAVGITNIVQNTGPIDRENGFSIGYSGVAGTKIGILHRRNGFAEIRTLTITTAPTGAQTANVTLNGTSFLISLTTSASTSYTAHQIAQQLKANASCRNLWDIDACDSIVTFVYYSPGAQNGSYSFSSSGTGTAAAGTFAQAQAGASPVDTWTYIDNWNGNVPASFDPAKLNVYGMDFRWLGAGRIRFFMEDPNTGKFTVIHTITWTKNQTGLYPHINNPSLRIVYRSGTTNTAITPSQNVVVSGASAFGAIQGIVNQTGASQSYYALDGSTRAKDTVWHLLSIQNPWVRNGQVNKSSLVLQDMSVATKSTDPAVIYIVKNAVGTSDLILFNPIPGATSQYFAQYSTTQLSENLSQDIVSLVQTLGVSGSAQFDLLSYNFVLNPGDYISIFMSSTTSFGSSTIGLAWRVD